MVWCLWGCGPCLSLAFVIFMCSQIISMSLSHGFWLHLRYISPSFLGLILCPWNPFGAYITSHPRKSPSLITNPYFCCLRSYRIPCRDYLWLSEIHKMYQAQIRIPWSFHGKTSHSMISRDTWQLDLMILRDIWHLEDLMISRDTWQLDLMLLRDIWHLED